MWTYIGTDGLFTRSQRAAQPSPDVQIVTQVVRPWASRLFPASMLEWVARCKPYANVIRAPETGASLVSLTTPRTEVVPVCPQDMGAISKSRLTNAKIFHTFSERIMFAPRAGRLWRIVSTNFQTAAMPALVFPTTANSPGCQRIKRWRLVSERNYPLFEGPVKHIFTIIFSIDILNSSDHVSH
jgi:hypothetical protein